MSKLKLTRWSPDTCGCRIEYAWDPALPVVQRVHIPVSVDPCERHAHLSEQAQRRATPSMGHEEIYAAVLAENQAKNRGAIH